MKLLQVIPLKKQFTKHNVVSLAEIVSSVIVVMDMSRRCDFQNGKGEGYTINYDLCTGCGVCAEQCPCHALDMVLEH